MVVLVRLKDDRRSTAGLDRGTLDRLLNGFRDIDTQDRGHERSDHCRQNDWSGAGGTRLPGMTSVGRLPEFDWVFPRGISCAAEELVTREV